MIKQVKQNKTYEIGAGRLGNGLTVWNRADRTSYGDYKNIAHISDDKTICYFESLPYEVRNQIEALAA